MNKQSRYLEDSQYQFQLEFLISIFSEDSPNCKRNWYLLHCPDLIIDYVKEAFSILDNVEIIDNNIKIRNNNSSIYLEVEFSEQSIINILSVLDKDLSDLI